MLFLLSAFEVHLRDDPPILFEGPETDFAVFMSQYGPLVACYDSRPISILNVEQATQAVADGVRIEQQGLTLPNQLKQLDATVKNTAQAIEVQGALALVASKEVQNDYGPLKSVNKGRSVIQGAQCDVLEKQTKVS